MTDLLSNKYLEKGVAQIFDTGSKKTEKMPESSKPYVIVTGFGPFGEHTVNASSQAVWHLKKEGLHNDDVNLHVTELPVAYSVVQDIVPQLWQQYKPVLMVHVGVSGVATELTLEQQANNDGYDREDVMGEKPCSKYCVEESKDCILSTEIDMEKVCQDIHNSGIGVRAVVSTNAGRYLCAYSYCTSLHINPSCSAFIHVPPIDAPYSVEQLAAGLRTAINAMLQQVFYKK